MQGMTTNATSEYLSVKEAAAELGVSPSTIWRWIEAGRLPAQRIGPKIIRLRRDDVSLSIATSVDSIPRSSPPRGRQGSPTLLRRTPEQQHAFRVAMERADEIRARILARRGGELVPSSTDIIREERDHRSRQT